MSQAEFCHPEHLRLLEPSIQQWVLDKRWPCFWPIQLFTIEKLLKEGERRDLILPAPTAGGKTMAALLPLLSQLRKGEQVPGSGYEILYVSPLKALITQQSDPRNDVATLAAAAGRPVIPWMGDIDSSIKNKSWDKPAGGILLITPESLEGRFLRRPLDLASRFGSLRAVIIDELHAYFESPRGPQLISLLTRLEDVTGRTLQRIALSATLGSGDERDWDRIYHFLRPCQAAAGPPRIPGAEEQHGEPPWIRLRVHFDEDRTDQAETARAAIAGDLRSLFDADGEKRTKTGLIFTNSRREAERFVNLLNAGDNAVVLPRDWARKQQKQDGVEEEPEPRMGILDKHFESADPATDRRRYWPHHGSLDRSIRTQGEKRMRSGSVPCTLVATTTLELGIDIGAIEEVAQIGPGYSVASLRQRMGRSGRPTLVVDEESGQVKQESPPSKLHVFLREPKLQGDEHVLDRLRLPTFQALAQVGLLREGRFEAPDLDQLHLSTFVQQLLSLIHQYRDQGLDKERAEEILVQRGPFHQLQQPLFERKGAGSIRIFDAVIERLRTRIPPLVDLDLEDPDSGRRELFLTTAGEAVVNGNGIYAAFRTPIEYTVKSSAGVLGTIGSGTSYGTGERILLSGRAWEILAIHHGKRLIEVRPASAGRAAYFTGDALVPSHAVVSEMRRLYEMEEGALSAHLESIADVDATGLRMLEEGRGAYREERLGEKPWVQVGGDLFLFPWVGHRRLTGLAASLRWAGVFASPFRMSVFVQNRDARGLTEAIDRLLKDGPRGFPERQDLARRFGSGATGKFDSYLSPSFWRRDFASSHLGPIAGIVEKLQEIRDALRGGRRDARD